MNIKKQFHYCWSRESFSFQFDGNIRRSDHLMNSHCINRGTREGEREIENETMTECKFAQLYDVLGLHEIELFSIYFANKNSLCLFRCIWSIISVLCKLIACALWEVIKIDLHTCQSTKEISLKKISVFFSFHTVASSYDLYFILWQAKRVIVTTIQGWSCYQLNMFLLLLFFVGFFFASVKSKCILNYFRFIARTQNV